MITVGSKVKVVKLIESDYTIHPTFAIGNVYQVMDITSEKCIRPLRYGLNIGCGELIYFSEQEVELFN